MDTLTIEMANIPNKEKVKVIVMDMWRPYRLLAQQHFPGRPIVVDKFHVLRMANNAVDLARKRERQSLDKKIRIKLKNERFVLLKRYKSLTNEERLKLATWIDLFSDLGLAYRLKERFFEIYDAPDRKSAEHLKMVWEKSIPEDAEHDFKELLTALRGWREEIFNYFDYPVTNAYTESANNIARSIDRMGRGYSFEVLRARLLYDELARKDTRTALRKRKRKEPDSETIDYAVLEKMIPGLNVETVIEQQVVEYGPYLPTLVRLLEEGYFS